MPVNVECYYMSMHGSCNILLCRVSAAIDYTVHKNIAVPVPGDVMCGVCVMCDAQCEISTVLSRYDVKAIRDLVRKTNVSLWMGGP